MGLISWIARRLRTYLLGMATEHLLTALAADKEKKTTEAAGTDAPVVALATNDIIDKIRQDIDAEIDKGVQITHDKADALVADALDTLAYTYLPGWTKAYIELSPDLRQLANRLQADVDRVLGILPTPEEQALALKIVADKMTYTIKDW